MKKGEGFLPHGVVASGKFADLDCGGSPVEKSPAIAEGSTVRKKVAAEDGSTFSNMVKNVSPPVSRDSPEAGELDRFNLGSKLVSVSSLTKSSPL